jgi:hypothetical protein
MAQQLFSALGATLKLTFTASNTIAGGGRFPLVHPLSGAVQL